MVVQTVLLSVGTLPRTMVTKLSSWATCWRLKRKMPKATLWKMVTTSCMNTLLWVSLVFRSSKRATSTLTSTKAKPTALGLSWMERSTNAFSLFSKHTMLESVCRILSTKQKSKASMPTSHRMRHFWQRTEWLIRNFKTLLTRLVLQLNWARLSQRLRNLMEAVVGKSLRKSTQTPSQRLQNSTMQQHLSTLSWRWKLPSMQVLTLIRHTTILLLQPFTIAMTPRRQMLTQKLHVSTHSCHWRRNSMRQQQVIPLLTLARQRLLMTTHSLMPRLLLKQRPRLANFRMHTT